MAEASSPSGKFVWYEYMGNDLKAGVDFYTGVVGWSAKDAGMGFDFAYQILSTGSTMVAGMMDVPEEAKAMGAGPSWMGYIWVEDVDKALPKLTAAGGKVYKAPADIPGVGRFAVVADPDGAAFMLFKDAGGNPPPPPPPGAPAWSAGVNCTPATGPAPSRSIPVSSAGRKSATTTLGRWASTTFSTPATASRAASFPRRRKRPRRSGSITSTSTPSTQPSSGSRRTAGKSSTGRWRRPTADGSCKGSIRRARCSRW